MATQGGVEIGGSQKCSSFGALFISGVLKGICWDCKIVEENVHAKKATMPDV